MINFILRYLMLSTRRFLCGGQPHSSLANLPMNGVVLLLLLRDHSNSLASCMDERHQASQTSHSTKAHRTLQKPIAHPFAKLVKPAFVCPLLQKKKRHARHTNRGCLYVDWSCSVFHRYVDVGSILRQEPHNVQLAIA